MMNKPQLIDTFCKNHEELAGYINALPDADFIKSNNGKWTPGQQLSHVYMCLLPISKALASAAYIGQKFGRLNRTPMSYGEVIDRYKTALANGGKAPEQFVPGPVPFENKAALVNDFAGVLNTIKQQLNSYTDEDLNTLVLPHPLLGNLSINELFYLMTHHATHHQKQTEQNLAQQAEG